MPFASQPSCKLRLHGLTTAAWLNEISFFIFHFSFFIYPPLLPIRKKLNIFALHFHIATLNDIDY